jgi:hypothetical protein
MSAIIGVPGVRVDILCTQVDIENSTIEVSEVLGRAASGLNKSGKSLKPRIFTRK